MDGVCVQFNVLLLLLLSFHLVASFFAERKRERKKEYAASRRPVVSDVCRLYLELVHAHDYPGNGQQTHQHFWHVVHRILRVQLFADQVKFGVPRI